MEGDTPKPGETQTPEAPKNATPPPTPQTGNEGDQAGEAEKLRKELEQARMREQQLLNEKKAREEAEEAKKAKKLEEQNEFKELYEQEKAKREAIESEREAESRRQELEKARTEVLANYSDEVKALAEEAGMNLGSSDEDAKVAFKEKLDKIQNMVGSTGKVTPNNPGKPTQKPKLTQDELRVALKDEKSFEEIVAQRPGIAAMMSKR